MNNLDSSLNPPAIIRPSVIHIEQQALERIEQIKVAKQEIKNRKEMIESAVQNSSEYRSADEEYQQALRKRRAARSQVVAQPDMQRLKIEIDSYKEDIKDKQMSLFSSLESYVKESGSHTIEDNMTGELYSIQPKYSLKKSRRK